MMVMRTTSRASSIFIDDHNGVASDFAGGEGSIVVGLEKASCDRPCLLKDNFVSVLSRQHPNQRVFFLSSEAVLRTQVSLVRAAWSVAQTRPASKTTMAGD